MNEIGKAKLKKLFNHYNVDIDVINYIHNSYQIKIKLDDTYILVTVKEPVNKAKVKGIIDLYIPIMNVKYTLKLKI